MIFFRLLATLVLVASFTNSIADELKKESQKKASPPVVVKKEGQPATATFADGRIATLYSHTKEKISFETPFDVTEVSCSGKFKTTGSYQTEYVATQLTWVWTSHPDPKKIGKVVQRKFNGPPGSEARWEDMAAMPSLFSLVQKNDFPKGTAVLDNAQIRFADNQFLNEIKRTKSGGFEILEWTAEAMFNNPETGLNENRVIGGAMNMQLKQLGTNRFEITQVDQYFSFFKPALDIVGEVMQWTLFDKNDQLCFVVIQPDLAASGGDRLIDYWQNFPLPSGPYIWGSDESYVNSLDATFRLSFVLGGVTIEVR